jgi:hypothetical protein
MKTIKTVKNENNNKTYRVRNFNNSNHYIIDTFETRLNASKVEVKGYYYVTCADSKSELNNKLDILTK